MKKKVHKINIIFIDLQIMGKSTTITHFFKKNNLNDSEATASDATLPTTNADIPILENIEIPIPEDVDIHIPENVDIPI